MTSHAPAVRPLLPAAGSGTFRTGRALLASGLGILPLVELFTDVRWLLDAWLAMAVVVVPGLLLRLWQRPHVGHTWLGMVLLIPWLTARFVPHHAFAGILPTHATWHDVDTLLTEVRDTTSNGVAPVHAGPAIDFVLAIVLGLLAAFVDLIAVVGHRPALAGVPLLVVYTVSGAVPRHPVSWLLFVPAAIAFLLLLSLDAGDTVREWGRLIPRLGDSRPSAALGVSGPRIAVLAIGVAVVLPLIVPSRPANLIANALHNGSSHGSGGSTGFGANGGVSLDPFSALKGELKRTKPVDLFTVDLDPTRGVQPFYLRANVLADYSDLGWSAGAHGGSENITSTFFETVPPSPADANITHFSVRIKIIALADNPPVFARPTEVHGVDGNTTWSVADQLVLGSRVHRDQQITEQVDQPAPTTNQLSAAAASNPQDVEPWLRVPATMPALVGDLVAQLTAGKSTPYAKARALSDYFTNAANGFTYSLETKNGDSGSDLVDFLTNKTGYCQQYAAAMGIMLRMAGVPARVVLGYTHGNPDANGRFTVTTNNAHAWVEAYFAGLGWIPFDPTPISGAAGGATTNLPWAPHPAGSINTAETIPTKQPSRSSGASGAGGASSAPVGSRSNNSGIGLAWPALLTLGVFVVVVVALLAPAAVRSRRRRGRLRSARQGDPDPLWAELSDTAIDLGYVWSPARSPRQVVGWLGPQVRDSATALHTLAAAVETARYAPGTERHGGPVLIDELREVEARLRARRSTSTRIRSRLLPASLGWKLRLRWRR